MEWYDNKFRIAEKNITCYIGCYINKGRITLPQKYNKSKFKGCINNINCEGEIHIDKSGIVIFHTFNAKLNDQTQMWGNPIEHPIYPFGEFFSTNTSITKLTVNDKSILKEIKLLLDTSNLLEERYSYRAIDVGEKESKNIKIAIADNCYTKKKDILNGYVSFIKNDKNNQFLHKNCNCVVKCIIPKGTTYVLGWCPTWHEKATYYVSETLIYKKLI